VTGSEAVPAAPVRVWSSITAAAITKSAGWLPSVSVAIRACIDIGRFGAGYPKFYLNPHEFSPASGNLLRRFSERKATERQWHLSVETSKTFHTISRRPKYIIVFKLNAALDLNKSELYNRNQVLL
jgi:hypothetical protein